MTDLLIHAYFRYSDRHRFFLSLKSSTMDVIAWSIYDLGDAIVSEYERINGLHTRAEQSVALLSFWSAIIRSLFDAPMATVAAGQVCNRFSVYFYDRGTPGPIAPVRVDHDGHTPMEEFQDDILGSTATARTNNTTNGYDATFLQAVVVSGWHCKLLRVYETTYLELTGGEFQAINAPFSPRFRTAVEYVRRCLAGVGDAEEK